MIIATKIDSVSPANIPIIPDTTLKQSAYPVLTAYNQQIYSKLAAVNTRGFPKGQRCVDNTEHLRAPSQEPTVDRGLTIRFDSVPSVRLLLLIRV